MYWYDFVQSGQVTAADSLILQQLRRITGWVHSTKPPWCIHQGGAAVRGGYSAVPPHASTFWSCCSGISFIKSLISLLYHFTLCLLWAVNTHLHHHLSSKVKARFWAKTEKETWMEDRIRRRGNYSLVDSFNKLPEDQTKVTFWSFSAY